LRINWLQTHNRVKKTKIKNFGEESHNKATSERLRISFEFIDWESDAFFVHGLTKRYYELLFETFCEIEKSTAEEIKQQRHPRLIPKYINWNGDSTITKRSFPEKIKHSLIPQCGNNEEELERQFKEMTRDSFELRVAKGYGRIHGFIFGNTFYIVWFYPAHNLFPGRDDKGRTQKIKLPNEIAQVKTFCPKEINRLKELNISLYAENQKLIQENHDFFNLAGRGASWQAFPRSAWEREETGVQGVPCKGFE